MEKSHYFVFKRYFCIDALQNHITFEYNTLQNIKSLYRIGKDHPHLH